MAPSPTPTPTIHNIVQDSIKAKVDKEQNLVVYEKPKVITTKQPVKESLLQEKLSTFIFIELYPTVSILRIVSKKQGRQP